MDNQNIFGESPFEIQESDSFLDEYSFFTHKNEDDPDSQLWELSLSKKESLQCEQPAEAMQANLLNDRQNEIEFAVSQMDAIMDGDIDSQSLLGNVSCNAEELPLLKLDSDLCDANQKTKSTEITLTSPSGAIHESKEVDLNKIVSDLIEAFSLENPSLPKPSTPIFKARWGKEKDRELFAILEPYCKENHIEMEEFLNDTANELELSHSEILDSISAKLDWRGTNKYLVVRIKKILNATKFSARDYKLLKKLVIKQQKDNDLSFSKLMYYFPGKSIDYVREEASVMFKTNFTVYE